MAGIFGFFDYSKPGKGVEKDEPQKPRFLYFWELFFRKFWKLIQLNLLYVASCLLIFTIGPATAGFTYVLRNLANEQPVFLVSDFFDGFKNNAKQSILYSVIMTAALIMLVTSMRFYYLNLGQAAWMYVPLSICILLLLLLVFMSFYVMLMIVTLDLKLTAILKNAVIFSIICLKTNFITLFFIAVILFAVYIFPVLGALLTILIIPAMCGFIICFNMFPQIKKYAVDPYNERQKASESGDDAVFSDKEEQ
ncbi:MAG: DUF624 domain-containing protein [Oscillospiraceae bacterium]|nr:DUF624 domain-containing protein [Oscillospiraceae bacterium]